MARPRKTKNKKTETMKLIIPMAGRGTRVRPHSHTTPKPLLPVAGTMIIERIVETFSRTLDGTIDEIVYILGPDFGREIKEELAAVSARHQAEAVFKVQERALGTAHAVGCAGDRLSGEVIIVFADTLFDTAGKVSVQDADSVIWLKEVEDPSRFGVAVHEGDVITDFVEKPSEPISKLAIIGVYYFKEGEDLAREIQYLMDHNVTGHGDEYQLTDALDRLLKGGSVFKKATVDEWLDCGTLPAWLETTFTVLGKERVEGTGGAEAFPGCVIREPVHLGEGVVLEDSEIGPFVSVEAGAKISRSKIRRSIVREQAVITESDLTDSTVGRDASVRGLRGEVHVGDHSVVRA